ncbi:MAG: sigma-54-dependent Fis family transcriptional regulator [bacterium]|nr:sigma-54-dependent Fis family transcriptional regulator [Candidatus Kapabacteria bacterium]
MARILVVDDQANVRKTYSMLLSANGHEVVQAKNGQEGLDLLTDDQVDLVISDIKMEPVDGMTLLRDGKKQYPDTEFLMVTGFSSVKDGVEAMKAGAYDYVTKQTNTEELLLLVDKAIEKRKLTERLRHLQERVAGTEATTRIIGTAPELRDVLSIVEKVAPTDTTVLLLGESGTGKELIAEAVHQLSNRANRNFVAVNCGAIPPNLEESTLFGHSKGSFTGAIANKDGLFKEADGGTIFLDEIGEMQLDTQAKLLRVLQNKEITRVGDNRPTRVDVRVVAATNREFKQMVDDGLFRKDLYYRLNVISLQLPPLRQRGDDIIELANYFALMYSERMNKQFAGCSPKLLEYLRSYNWPGNIRELQNIIERLVILSEGPHLDEKHLPKEIVFGPPPTNGTSGVEELTLAEMERRYILDILERYDGQKSVVADKLGISTTTLWRKLKEYGVN